MLLPKKNENKTYINQGAVIIYYIIYKLASTRLFDFVQGINFKKIYVSFFFFLFL